MVGILLADLLTYLHTYLLTCLRTYLLTDLLTCTEQLTYLLTYLHVPSKLNMSYVLLVSHNLSQVCEYFIKSITAIRKDTVHPNLP